MDDTLPTGLAEWLTLAAKITGARHLAELEAATAEIFAIVFPRQQFNLVWRQRGQPAPAPANAEQRTLRSDDTIGWLTVWPASFSAEERATLSAIEQLIVIGYERVRLQRAQPDWRQRLRAEVAALRDCADPDVICRQLGMLIADTLATPVSIGIVAPIERSSWVALIARYRSSPDTEGAAHQYWPANVDLSSAVLRLGVPIQSISYLEDCARYDVRPHPDHSTRETAPAYWLGAPIRFGGETLGVVYVCAPTTGSVNEEQQQCAGEALYYAGQLLRPVILQREIERLRNQRAAWMELAQASAHLIDPDRALQAMLDASARLLEVYGGGLFFFDEQSNELVFRCATGRHAEKLVGFRLPLSRGIIGQSFRADKPIIVNDAANDPRRSHVIDTVINVQCYNLVSVPFTTPAGARACLEFVNRYRQAPFIDYDVELIKAIAALMSLVIDHAQQRSAMAHDLVEQAQALDRSNADLRSVLALGQELLADELPERLFQRIVDAICQRMNFLSAALFVNLREHRVHPVLECVVTKGELAGEFPLGTPLAASRLDMLITEWSFSESCFLINRQSQTFAALFDTPPTRNRLMEFGAEQWDPDDLLVALLRATNRNVEAVLLLDQPVGGRRPNLADLQALMVYAGIAGVAIDMALLRYRLQNSLERLTALNSLGMVINSQSLPQPQVLEMTARGMMEMVDAQWAQIVMRDLEQDTLQVERVIGSCTLDRDVIVTLARRALVQRRPVFRSATTVAIPLRGAQHIIGIFVIGGNRALETADIEMLMLYASQAAVAVENMRLLEAVRRGRDNLAQVMAAVSDGLLLFTIEGRIIVANQAFSQLTRAAEWSTPPDRLTDWTIDRLLNEWAAQRALDADAVARLQRSLTVPDAQGELTGSDGVFAWSLNRAGETGKGYGQAMLLTLRDVTAARAAERMRDDLTHMLIHDLRNPLTKIALAFEQLKNELGDLFTMQQQQTLKVGQQSAHQLLHLVNTMLEIGRLESGRMPLDRGPWPIEHLIERVIDPFAWQARQQNVQLVVHIDPQVQMLFVDAELMARVFQNLLDNALKFSPVAGVITVEGSVAPATGVSQTIELSDEMMIVVPGDRVAHFVVRDQGPGIPLAEQEQIFAVFSQASHRYGEGSGLGLAFCRLAVEAHQGKVWVESAPGQGSAFHIILPLAEFA